MSIVYLLIAALIGAGAAWVAGRGRASAELARRDTQLEERGRALDEARSRIASSESELLALRDRASRLETSLAEERRQSGEKLALLVQARDELKAQFEALAAKILDEKTAKFTQQNEAQVGALLTPLREQLADFKRKVEEAYVTEAKERSALGEQVRHLSELNRRMSEEAQNLTRALRGDNKLQGNWGEFNIRRIFDESGLKQGRDYEVQTAVEGAAGQRQILDFIVHLPEGRDVIVDSKVSLIAYDDAVRAEDDDARSEALGRLVASVRAHFTLLASKEYHQARGVRSPDYVLMCMPVEPAFMLALGHAPGLADEAFRQGVILVSPTSLLHTLKIVASLWRIEDQNRNAAEIARASGNLYDKFVGFVEDLQRIGERIEQARAAYDGAYNKLRSGKGNLVDRAEHLRELGVKPRKQLQAALRSDAADDAPADGSD